MLDPTKGMTEFTTVQITTALSALVKIGKPAADAAVKLLKGGKDDKLVRASRRRRIGEITGQDAKGQAVRGNGGAHPRHDRSRQDSIPAMVEAMKSEKDDSTKAIIARELTKMPATDRVEDNAFKNAFESLPLDSGDSRRAAARSKR